MRKTIQFLQLAFILLLATACAETSPFKYESVPNDPLKARILPFAWEVKTILPKRPVWHTILNT